MDSHYTQKSLLSILITVFFLAFGMSFVSPIIPLLLRSIGASSADIGYIQTGYFFSFTIATAVVGRFIDRIGSKRIIISGLIVFGTAVSLMPYLTSITYFYIIRIVQGIGSSMLFAPTEAAINILSPPEKRGTNMGLYGLVFAVGFSAGPVIGASLYAMHTQLPFLFCGAMCIVSMLALVIGFSETVHPAKKTMYKNTRMYSVLKIPLTAAICYAFIEVSIVSFLALYLEFHEIHGGRLGAVFSCFAVGGAVSPLPAGKLSDRFGKIRVLKWCAVILLCITICCNFSVKFWYICFMMFSVGIIAGSLYPVALSLIADIMPPEKIGSANAAFTFCYGIGSISGPLITGLVLDIFDITLLFIPMGISAFILYFVLLRNKLNSVY